MVQLFLTPYIKLAHVALKQSRHGRHGYLSLKMIRGHIQRTQCLPGSSQGHDVAWPLWAQMGLQSAFSLVDECTFCLLCFESCESCGGGFCSHVWVVNCLSRKCRHHIEGRQPEQKRNAECLQGTAAQKSAHAPLNPKPRLWCSLAVIATESGFYWWNTKSRREPWPVLLIG